VTHFFAAASNLLSRSTSGSWEVVPSLSWGLECSLDFRASPKCRDGRW
jgi:hypothetical protein